MKNNIYNKGISGLEVFIVVAVLGILFAVILPQFQENRERQVLSAAAGDILSSLNRARSQTLASVDSSSYGVRFQADKIIIFKGTSYSAGAPDNENIAILSPASISNVTLNGTSGAAGELYFARISGSPSKSGTVTLSTPNLSKIITISQTGAASAD